MIGHVKNGVIVVGDGTSLPDGQPVRVEPLDPAANTGDEDSTERIRKLERLFAEWTEEDGKLSGEEADRLQAALEQHRGLGFRAAKVD